MLTLLHSQSPWVVPVPTKPINCRHVFVPELAKSCLVHSCTTIRFAQPTAPGGLSQVYLCARSWQNPAWAKESKPFGAQNNIYRRPVPSKLGKDGSVTFTDGQHVDRVDTVMYCTGYLYSFPFLRDVVDTADNRCRVPSVTVLCPVCPMTSTTSRCCNVYL